MKKFLFLIPFLFVPHLKAASSPMMTPLLFRQVQGAATNYGVLDGTNQAVENDNKILFASTGTLTNLWLSVSGNTITGGNSTYLVRKNNVDDNLVITIASGTTGNFSDDVDTVTINGDDQLNYTGRGGGVAGGTITFAGTSVLYTANTNTVSRVSRNTNNTSYVSGTKWWYNISTEAYAQHYIPTTGTCANMSVKAGINTNLGVVTVVSRKNGSNGNMTVSITSSTSGIFQDKVNTDSVVQGDLYTFQFTGGVSGNLTPFSQSFDFITTTNDSMAAIAGVPITLTSTSRWWPSASPGDNNAETNAPRRLGMSATIKNIAIYLSSNPTTATSSFILRRSTSSTIVIATITASTGGWFSDNLHSSFANANELVNFQFTRGSANNQILQSMTVMYHSTPTADINVDDLIAYYKLDDNAATSTVVDSALDGYNGVLNSSGAAINTSQVSVAGKIGNAFQLDSSTNEWVDITDINAEDNLTQYSMAAWVQFIGTVTIRETIIGKSDGGAEHGLRTNDVVSSTTNFVVGVPSSYVAVPSVIISTGVWYHIVGTFDNTLGTNKNKIYVNGVLQTVNSIGTPDAKTTNGNPAANNQIGRLSASAGRYFNGIIDEVRLYGRALSQDDVTTLYNYTGTPAVTAHPRYGDFNIMGF